MAVKSPHGLTPWGKTHILCLVDQGVDSQDFLKYILMKVLITITYKVGKTFFRENIQDNSS